MLRDNLLIYLDLSQFVTDFRQNFSFSKEGQGKSRTRATLGGEWEKAKPIWKSGPISYFNCIARCVGPTLTISRK
jgi:hypothetical protein